MFLHKFQYLTGDCGIGTNVPMIDFPVAQLFHLCILRWHDADSDLRCLAKIWTVERDGRHWPPPHSLPGFLAQALKVSILDHLMAPSATLRSRLLFSIRRNVGNQSVFKGNFLDLAGHVPQIYQQAIHLYHPHQRILLSQARKRPLGIERMGPNRLFDGAGLSVDGALADFENGTQLRGRHVWGKGWVTKKVDPAEHIDNAARPCSRLPGSKWARALPAERCGHCARQGPIFGVQMPVAHVVG